LKENGCPWDEDTCEYAVQGGYVDMLDWAYKKGCFWNPENQYLALGFGKLYVFQWIHKNKLSSLEDEKVCNSAIGHANRYMLPWLIENGYKVGEKVLSFADHPQEESLRIFLQKHGYYTGFFRNFFRIPRNIKRFFFQ